MDYKNGKIYQILNNINDEVYVGSTLQPLSKRFYSHKTHSDHLNNKLHELMRTIGKNNCYIELIENYPCNSKEELRAREGHYIRERGTLNMKIAGRTDKAYYKDNQEIINAKHKKYYEDNQECILQRNKHYYENNKAIILERTKQYSRDNKEYINEKVMCDTCGCQSTRHNLARHQKTKKCKSYVKPDECNNLIKMD